MTYWARRIHGRDQWASVAGDGDTVLARYALGSWPAYPVVSGSSMPTTVSTAPAPDIRVTHLDKVLFVRGIASVNVRVAPGTRNDKVGVLPPGAAVEVTGKVVGRDWYRVALVGGTSGYVFAPLLGPPNRPATHAYTPQPPAPPDHAAVPWPIQVSSLVLGHEVGRKDRRYIYRTTQQSLEWSRTGVTSTWRNPVSGSSGSITPVRTYQNAYGQPCRIYNQTFAYLGALVQRTRLTACRDPHGKWSFAH
jgi:hypothetical protein